MSTTPYDGYVNKMRTIADLRFSAALLQWDQETYLPPKGAEIRGQQIATLSELAHHSFTDEALGKLLQDLNGDKTLPYEEKRNVELTWEDYSKLKKLPASFVRTLTEAANKSFHSWINARKTNDFSVFAPDLDKVVELKKQEADL